MVIFKDNDYINDNIYKFAALGFAQEDICELLGCTMVLFRDKEKQEIYQRGSLIFKATPKNLLRKRLFMIEEKMKRGEEPTPADDEMLRYRDRQVDGQKTKALREVTYRRNKEKIELENEHLRLENELLQIQLKKARAAENPAASFPVFEGCPDIEL